MWQNLIHWLESHSLPCQFYRQYHTECPGCGFQSAFISLLKGNFSESFQTYPALLPILLLIVSLCMHLRIRARWTLKSNRILVGMAILLVLVNYLQKTF